MVDNFLIFIAGLSLSITPAKAGEAIRAFLLKEKVKSGLSEGLASTFSESDHPRAGTRGGGPPLRRCGAGCPGGS